MKIVSANNDVYYQVKERPVFLACFWAEKSGLFCVQFDLVFFAKQSEGFFVFFSADFLRLAAALFSVC